jgi:hypothetical protein
VKFVHTSVSSGLRYFHQVALLETVETEVNGDSKSSNERAPSLVGSLGFLGLVLSAQEIFALN